jgi:hypothetical protein
MEALVKGNAVPSKDIDYYDLMASISDSCLTDQKAIIDEYTSKIET